MQRKLEYISDTPVNRLGRFGRVEKGDVLKVNEDEYNSTKDDPRFRPIRERQVGIEPDADYDLVNPGPSASFDLTTISWERGNLLKRLGRRTRPTLSKIAKAIEEQTGMDLLHGHLIPRRDIAESIFYAARTQGWTSGSHMRGES